MPKVTVGYSGTTYGSAASNGSTAVVFTAAKNPDGSSVKDTRK